MRIKCESCGKVYNTDTDELCPECGAYNDFDKGACTHYDSEGGPRGGKPSSQCGHTKAPEFRPKTYQPQEYVPQEMPRQTTEAPGQKAGWGSSPPQYRPPARAEYSGEPAPRRKGGKALPITIALLVAFSIFAPPVAELAAQNWAYGISAAGKATVIPFNPENHMEVGGEFILTDWQAQRVYEEDGTSYLYVTAQARSVGESSSYYRMEPYMEAADDFWAPAADADLEWAFESMGFSPDCWGLYFAERSPKTVGWIFPDFGEPVACISIASIEKGSDGILRSLGKVYQVEITITEGGDYYGGI